MNRLVLSQRQWDVLYGASRGETAAQTAERLRIGYDTVREYRKIVRLKLDARTMTEATAFAIRDGVILP